MARALHCARAHRMVAVFAAVVVTLVALSSAAAAAGNHGNTRQLVRAAGATPADPAVRSLLSYVPTNHRYSCVSLDTTAANSLDEVAAATASITAAVSCRTDSAASSVSYYRFADATALNSVYEHVETNVGQPKDPDCEGDSGWTFHDDSSGGRILCFIGTRGASGDIPATAALVWTANESNILGVASAGLADTDAARLREWWDRWAGPKRSPDDTGMAAASNVISASTARAVLRTIPTRTRSACRAADPSDPDAIGASLVDSRYFLEGVVVCTRPDAAVDKVTYSKLAPEIVEDFAAQAYGLSKTPTAAVDGPTNDAQCPTESTYSTGKAKKKRQLGTYACYFLDNGDGTQRVVWRWTDTRQGILAIATNSSGDADALANWWRSRRSGPIQT